MRRTNGQPYGTPATLFFFFFLPSHPDTLTYYSLTYTHHFDLDLDCDFTHSVHRQRHHATPRHATPRHATTRPRVVGSRKRQLRKRRKETGPRAGGKASSFTGFDACCFPPSFFLKGWFDVHCGLWWIHPEVIKVDGCKDGQNSED